MQIEYLKVHTDKSGRAFKIGQIADMQDDEARELIRQGIVKQRTEKPGEKPPAEGEPKQ